jgi:hypothetical protein
VLLISTGGVLFLYKVFQLGYPLRTADQPRTWRVEQVINVSGEGGRIVVDSPLPRPSRYQRVLTEVVRSDVLRFSIAEESGSRRGRWSGKVDGSTRVSYQVTVTTRRYRRKLAASNKTTAYSDLVAAYLNPSPGVQADDPAVADLSRELVLTSKDKARLAREIFAFVSREIGSLRSTGRMDALSVIREGRGDALGRARLFCALARANGLPCRIITGLVLRKAGQERLYYWNEAYVGRKWVPFDVVARLAEVLPANRLELSKSDEPDIQTTGTTAVSYRFYVQPETEPRADLVHRRITEAPSLLDRFSLLLLPVHIQQSIRLLLLVPLGALAMAILRNIIGIRTFGMFMPMLIALAMTTTGLLLGSVFLAAIVGLALLSRLWIQRFYLLLAPRIAFTLTLVILLMIGLMLVGDRFHIAIGGVGVFPFVIMTMIVERISVSLEEEGVRNTFQRIASTLFAIYATYAVIEADVLQTLFLAFPELLIVILGLLVLVGRYTGYRLTELLRFRDLLLTAPTGEAARADHFPPAAEGARQPSTVDEPHEKDRQT